MNSEALSEEQLSSKMKKKHLSKFRRVAIIPQHGKYANEDVKNLRFQPEKLELNFIKNVFLHQRKVLQSKHETSFKNLYHIICRTTTIKGNAPVIIQWVKQF